MSKTDIAIQKFASGCNCAQSVLSSFGNDLNLNENTALKIACGFGAGMGRMQEVCGAVSGGIMVIGMKYGQARADDREAKEKTYAMTRELMERFERKHGSCRCKALLKGCELLTEDGQKEFKDNGLHDKVCKECVKSVVEILEKLV